ncbi:ribosomal RNA small subunit methyltransferase I [Lentibacillus kapialis]|uniref:Ribosomal RNA small subunit methyltransferase I n=1 Tax=Lentibacillus kapialis TaxID=340214 RepID=A0A917UW87_9BACI|nr:16S rRNA (cytidine(1402)-2'-O)-methyltransferase [Lentibacillus kapialis]GGJ89293.1 ribosomal RNA small subunit methyltransferase I [Lentibacillus kapialis]
MKIQKSFSGQENSTVYVIPTPIGNLEDITFRALRVLKEVSIIAAEDTRNTKKLLHHFDISSYLISYHEHNKETRGRQLLDRLDNGESIAIVSDAGMPGISDPGYEFVQTAIESDYPVVVLPGANAALCALAGSGLPADEFLFYGFLPRKKKEKETELARIRLISGTLIFYESPFRIKDTLKMVYTHLGNRRVTIARELTKKFEEYVRGTAAEIIDWADKTELKGEFCLVVEGASQEWTQENDRWWSSLSVVEHVSHYINESDLSSKDAIKCTASDRRMPKRDVYQAYHIDQ